MKKGGKEKYSRSKSAQYLHRMMCCLIVVDHTEGVRNDRK